MSDLERAKEALRAAGFRPMRGHGQWSRDRPDIGVLEVVEMFDDRIVTISLWPEIAVLPAVLAALNYKRVTCPECEGLQFVPTRRNEGGFTSPPEPPEGESCPTCHGEGAVAEATVSLAAEDKGVKS